MPECLFRRFSAGHVVELRLGDAGDTQLHGLLVFGRAGVRCIGDEVLGRLPRCLDAGQLQLVDGVFRRDVASQIPCVRVQQRVHEGVVKHAVEHHVEVVPHDDLLFLLTMQIPSTSE